MEILSKFRGGLFDITKLIIIHIQNFILHWCKEKPCWSSGANAMDCNNHRKLLLSCNNNSYWVLIVIITYGIFLKQVSQFDVTPYSWNFASCPFLSVLVSIDMHLSKKRGFVILWANVFWFLFQFLCHLLRNSPSVVYITHIHPYCTLIVYVS